MPPTPLVSPVLLKAKRAAVVLAGKPKVGGVDAVDKEAGNPNRFELAVTALVKLKPLALVAVAGGLAETLNRDPDVVVAAVEKQNEGIVLACVNAEEAVVLATEKLNPLMLNPAVAAVVTGARAVESFPEKMENDEVDVVIGLEKKLKAGAVNPDIIAGFVVAVVIVEAEEGAKEKPKAGVVPAVPELEAAADDSVVADKADPTEFGREKGNELNIEEVPVAVVDETEGNLAEKPNTGVEMDGLLDITDVELAEKLNAGVVSAAPDFAIAEKLNSGVVDVVAVVEATDFPKKLIPGVVEVVGVAAVVAVKELAEKLNSGAEDEAGEVVDESAEMLSSGVSVATVKLNTGFVLSVPAVEDTGKLKLGAAVYAGLDGKLNVGTDELAMVVSSEKGLEAKFVAGVIKSSFGASTVGVRFSSDVVTVIAVDFDVTKETELVEVGVLMDDDDSPTGFSEREKLNPNDKDEAFSGAVVDLPP